MRSPSLRLAIACSLAVTGVAIAGAAAPRDRHGAAARVASAPEARPIQTVAATRTASHDVPLRVGDGQHLIVDGTVNSILSGPMLLDTGSSYCVLTRSAATRLGLAPSDGRRVPVVTANGQVAANLVRLDSMQLRGARLGPVDAVVMDAVEPPLIGIIGLNFLNRFRYSVDVAEGTLRLER